MWPASDDCWREQGPRYVVPVDRLPLVPFKTPFSELFGVFRLFRAFSRIQAALAYPPDHFSPERRKAPNTLLYGFLTQDGLWPSWPPLAGTPTPGRLN